MTICHVNIVKQGSDVQVCQQRLSSAFDLLLIFLCSLIQTLTLTPPPNNALLLNMKVYVVHMYISTFIIYLVYSPIVFPIDQRD